ncbi:hypothetical protein BD289DRAFT_484024 [Coniella lustricola]|uniref:CAP-Gly domain-containing protein n=1 Tax=Coniella lustricola TaxID=2025994 RepID=A0A2T3A3C2_9PEZI|nr:hypothetical protein BD289DRAFT_484024 [Coniella lustricola]
MSSSSPLQALQPTATALRTQQLARPTTNTTTATPGTTGTPPVNNTSVPLALRRPNARKASGLAKKVTASTPNLRVAFLDSSPGASPKLTPPSPLLHRKASHAALTPNSLATIPDVSEGYALATLNGSPSQHPPSPANNKMVPAPLTPRGGGTQFGGDLSVGDIVDVPGEMQGTVRFVGSIPGKKGVFAGVELQPDFAPRGKNNGDVDGVSYFNTNIPGAGIFLPLNKAVKRDAAPFSSTPSAAAGLRAGTLNSTNQTTSASQFNKPPGPGRAPSPRKMRPSLSHPESPGRRGQAPPGPRPSMGPPGKNMPRFGGSPTQTKFAPNNRGPATPNDPAKRGMLQPNRNFSVGPRSGSALSARSTGFTTDDELQPPSYNNMPGFRDVQRPGSSRGQQMPSRQAMVQDDEIERLRAEVAERDRQLKEQAATLLEMEHSLTEVQSLMEQADLPAPSRGDSLGSLSDKDTSQLRAMLKEKNEKIAMLTAEFDSHRADFRSTIDTLELASAETERVYEKRIEELMHDLQHIAERESDVDAVAAQLKQLEELVQELEEGLEDARRGEAEARGEVEFLRGEVERTRAELKREREKAASGAAIGLNNNNNTGKAGDQSAMLKELEQKEDEIRGLKAIIHSLSRDSVPDDGDRAPATAEDTAAREKLEREVAELRALLDTKNSRETELEDELTTLRRGSTVTLHNTDESSARDSRDTVVLADKLERLSLSNSSEIPQHGQRKAQHNRVRTLDTMPESDGLSSITEHSTLWCELCESAGHDILACTNMFGNQAPSSSLKVDSAPKSSDEGTGGLTPVVEHDRYKVAPLSPRVPFTATSSSSHEADQHHYEPAENPPTVAAPPPPMKPSGPLPSLLEPGPVAGKESGVVDPDAWCALCEKDGHNSVDCPFEDAF